VAISIAGFVIIYSALFVVEMFLMVRAIRKGPGQVQAPSALIRPLPGFGPAVPNPAE
jgi:cytochrome d ubiquinol oxidase subunit I